MTATHPIRNRERRSEYLYQRSIGYGARIAHRAAHDLYVFRKMEAAGLVRFMARPDDTGCDHLDFLDQDFYRETREGRAAAKDIRDKAERDGVWGIVAEYRIPYGKDYDPETGEGLTEWEQADSIWGMIGDDADTERDRTGYLADLASETLSQFKAEYRKTLANNR